MMSNPTKQIRGAFVPGAMTLLLLLPPTTARAELRTTWRELAPLPDPQGVAGAVVGLSGGALLVAGGSNFPPPVWDSEKVWHDKIWVLPAPDGKWLEAGRLPRRMGYAMTASRRDPRSGRDVLICVGGEDGKRVFAEGFTLAFDAEARRVAVGEFPSLPTPLAYAGAATLDGVLYVVGGQTGLDVATAIDKGYRIDLHDERPRWEPLPPIPGGARILSHVVAQRAGDRPLLFAIGGRRAGNDAAGLHFLRDTWAYDPATKTWTERTPPPTEVMAGQAVAVGNAHIVFAGYSDAAALREVARLGIPMRDFDHPGFPKSVLAYNTATDTWSTAGNMPASHVTTTAVRWHKAIVVPSGELKPRVRSPKVWHVTVEERP